MADHPQSERLRRKQETLLIARLDTLPMAGLTFKPIHPEDLPEVAAFLHEQQEIASRDDLTQAAPENNDLTGFQKDPDLSPGMSMGETLRDSEGKIRGMILGIPRMYRLGSQRLLGRAAGNFYVDASARMQGFFMLRRFLGAPGFDFYYANSCNRQSAPLWAKCGAQMVLESDVEYLLPFKLGPLAEEWASRKKWHPAVAAALKAAGPLATLVAAPRRPKHQFTLEYCVDLERLAVIADRNRDPELLQPEHSVAYLKWVYGSMPKSPSNAEISGVMYRFADPAGREGWFVLKFEPRGRKHQIRSAAPRRRGLALSTPGFHRRAPGHHRGCEIPIRRPIYSRPGRARNSRSVARITATSPALAGRIRPESNSPNNRPGQGGRFPLCRPLLIDPNHQRPLKASPFFKRTG